MIVVDASIILELLLQTPIASTIEQRVLGNRSETIHAPYLMDVEVLQVLRRYALRGVVSEHRGRLAVTLLSHFPITRYGHESLLPRIWTLRENLTAYDATYVALAEGLRCKLLTRDQHLASAPVARRVVELL